MTKIEYLYGIKQFNKILKDKKYKEALELKIELSEILVEKLLTIHYLKRESSRIEDSLKSQSFNRELLKELDETN